MTTLASSPNVAVKISGSYAVHALTATRVASGDTVLIHGAAGGVGQMAVQLAVARGARVIGTASPARHGVESCSAMRF